MSNTDNGISQNYDYEYQYANNLQNPETIIENYPSQLPSPVLIAMSALNDVLDHNKSLYQNDYIREEGFDLEIQCGKLKSQYKSNSLKGSDNIPSNYKTIDKENNESDSQQTVKKNNNQFQKEINPEDIYCYGSLEKYGYFRLVDAKNHLQSQMKYSFPDFIFGNGMLNQTNPLERNFFNDYILYHLVKINEKVPIRVIEKSKPMICCKTLLRLIRYNGYLSFGIVLISICLMIVNFLYYKDKNQNSFIFVVISILSVSSLISYYLFFRSLILFNHRSFQNWTLIFIAISVFYFFLCISSFITGSSIGLQLINSSICMMHCLLSFLVQDIGTKSIRFLVLVKVIPESELQNRVQFFG